MPTIPESPKTRWICCCEVEPPSLRCGPCNSGTFFINSGANHNGCHYPRKV